MTANDGDLDALERLDDFDHPMFPPGHRLRRHLLYRLRRDVWAAARAGGPVSARR